MYSLSFDKPVYSDPDLTTIEPGPFTVDNTTTLPSDIYFSATEYIGTAKNKIEQTMWTVRFTYPDHVSGTEISIATGAVYDE